MRRAVLVLMALVPALAGCQKAEEPPAGAAITAAGRVAKGRFVGVGLYAPGRMWTELASGGAAARASGVTPASLDDDEQVIVVVDSATGEIRQCGNLTGRCLAMNPWAQGVPRAWQAPALVARHRPQAEADDAARAR